MIIKKKILAMILTVAMVLTLIPVLPVLGAVDETFTVAVDLTPTISNDADINMKFKILAEEVTAKTGTVQVRNDISAAAIDKGTAGAIAIPTTVTRTVDSTTYTYTVTSIGDFAFYECKALTAVSIPQSVTSVGTYAFNSCDALESITIPAGVNTIGDNAFFNCAKLESITIPAGVKTIGNSVFSGCESLKSITIPAGVTSIVNHAFSNCVALKNVTFEANSKLESIGLAAFFDCDALESITIPAGVTSIGESAFASCKVLKTVIFEDGSKLESMGKLAFQYCDALESITIPDSVTSIGESAFYECDNLKEVYFEGDYVAGLDNGITSINTTGAKIYSAIGTTGWDSATTAARITYTLSSLTTNGGGFAPTNANYTATLTADTDYVLPQTITISVGNTALTLDTDGTLANGEYSYDSTSGKIVIHKDGITDNIAITATAIAVNNLQSVTQDNVTYGTAVSPQVVYRGSDTETNGGTVVLEYKEQSANDNTYTSTAPTYVGDYTVKATSAATPVTLAGEKTVNFSITAANQTPTISTTGSVIVGNDIDLSALITGQQGVVSFALSSGGGRLNGTTYTAPNTVETATFTVSITADNVDSSGANEYNAYTGALNISVTTAPTITDGSGQIVTQGQGFSVTSNDNFDTFEAVDITYQGQAQPINLGLTQTSTSNANANVKNGSIIATINGSYTATMPLGTHTITIHSGSGAAETQFTIVAPPAPTPTNPAIAPLTGVYSQ